MKILDYLKDNILILDGGMGSFLQEKGLQPGERPEPWNLSHPEVITGIHKSYYDAGSNAVITNTFGACGLRFSKEELEEIAAAAVANARRAAEESDAPQPKWVGLDVGPCGKLLKPFGDLEFVRYVMAIDPKYKVNTYGMGKYLLRHAFEADHLLPEEILWRQKAAFSDAVGHSMVDDLKAYAESLFTDAEFEQKRRKYGYARPFTKESLLYREIFEKYYPGQAEMIKDYWMPNREWEGCDVDDPSARVLSNYGASGN